jgi:predicted ATPase
MIEKIRFENFKALKDATLELGPLNVLVGPNGSGKSTVLQFFEMIQQRVSVPPNELRTFGADGLPKASISWRWEGRLLEAELIWHANGAYSHRVKLPHDVSHALQPLAEEEFNRLVRSIRVHSFDPSKIPEAVQLTPDTVLARDGANLAGALDRLRDQAEENWQDLKKELHNWLPEYNAILFETPHPGYKLFKLRQTGSLQTVLSRNVSEGTLVALALLLVIHDHNPPDLVCLEEPERNIHPRLMKDVRDGLYRLSYPEEFGLKRKAVQVLVTTHSPVFLNLLNEHPEAIIVSEKRADGTASFHRVDEDPHFREIVGDAPLGEVWFTGVLGGVPAVK